MILVRLERPQSVRCMVYSEVISNWDELFDIVKSAELASANRSVRLRHMGVVWASKGSNLLGLKVRSYLKKTRKAATSPPGW